MGHKRVKLRVIRTPKARASILAPMVHPGYTGDDNVDLLCGSCRIVLAKGLSKESFAANVATITQLLIKCPKCGAYNEIPCRKIAH